MTVGSHTRLACQASCIVALNRVLTARVISERECVCSDDEEVCINRIIPKEVLCMNPSLAG